MFDNIFPFGIDFNGDGKVDFTEGFLTYKLMEGSFGKDCLFADLMPDDDPEDDPDDEP
ncbi:MAG: hypothetical protein IK990_08395 [Ruminiclostridium sp.]|nr:hypothetical protein [Ruminiclostridium sp.]